MRSSVLEAHSRVEVLPVILVVVFAFLGRRAGDDNRRLQDTLTMESLYAVMKRLVISALILDLWLWALQQMTRSHRPATPIPAEWSGKVTDAAQLPVEQSTWGILQWVCNEKPMPGCAQTVGLATILPGKRNPVHYHPNCEEVLYVIAGQGLHSYDGRTIPLKAGMSIRIPPTSNTTW